MSAPLCRPPSARAPGPPPSTPSCPPSPPPGWAFLKASLCWPTAPAWPARGTPFVFSRPRGPVTRKRVPDREEPGKPRKDARRGRCHLLEAGFWPLWMTPLPRHPSHKSQVTSIGLTFVPDTVSRGKPCPQYTLQSPKSSHTLHFCTI